MLHAGGNLIIPVGTTDAVAATSDRPGRGLLFALQVEFTGQEWPGRPGQTLNRIFTPQKEEQARGITEQSRVHHRG